VQSFINIKTFVVQDSQLTPIAAAANGSSEILGSGASEDIGATPDLQKAKHTLGRLGDKIMRIKDQITEEQNTRDGEFRHLYIVHCAFANVNAAFQTVFIAIAHSLCAEQSKLAFSDNLSIDSKIFVFRVFR
jgi:hypothetical protein